MIGKQVCPKLYTFWLPHRQENVIFETRNFDSQKARFSKTIHILASNDKLPCLSKVDSKQPTHKKIDKNACKHNL